MIKTTQKQKYYISLFFIIAVIILLLLFVVYPTVRDIHKINKEITNKRIELESKFLQGLNIDKTKKELQNIKSELPSLDKIALQKGKELEFIQTLEKIAAEHNSEIKIISDFEDNNMSDSISSAPIKINVVGDFKDTLKIINEIENMPTYINADSILLTSDKTKNLFQLNGLIFFNI